MLGGVVMKPISFRIGVALLAFFLGVVASTIRFTYLTSPPESSLRSSRAVELVVWCGEGEDGTARQLIDHDIRSYNPVWEARRLEYARQVGDVKIIRVIYIPSRERCMTERRPNP